MFTEATDQRPEGHFLVDSFIDGLSSALSFTLLAKVTLLFRHPFYTVDVIK